MARKSAFSENFLYAMIHDLMQIFEVLSLIILIVILIGWLYRAGRSLSELRHAPILKRSTVFRPRSSVSILIPAKNEEKNITDCVKPLLGQLTEKDELIVINNCSEDRTETLLKSLGSVIS